MRRRTSTLLLAPAVAALAIGAGGCGNKSNSIHGGDTEGVFLNVGPMKYQVQISRQLNPSIPEDSTFLSDVGQGQNKLAPDELWFAVFIRVENPSKQAQPPASDYEITDTEHNVYRPVFIGPGNPFRYTTRPIPAHGVAPDPDSIAGQIGSINGQELLFRLKRSTFENRPLVLTIRSTSPPDRATDILDV